MVRKEDTEIMTAKVIAAPSEAVFLAGLSSESPPPSSKISLISPSSDISIMKYALISLTPSLP